MATLNIQVTSGLGTDARTLTFPNPDAQRIFNAWKQTKKNPITGIIPPLTQSDFVQDLANVLNTTFQNWVRHNETVVTPPTPPDIVIS